MRITDVRVRRITQSGKMKAVVSITLDNEFVVHDIKVIDGEKGLFIAMPSRKSADGEYRDIAHPINADMRKLVEDTILQTYWNAWNRKTYRHKRKEQGGRENKAARFSCGLVFCMWRKETCFMIYFIRTGGFSGTAFSYGRR